jgi:hypothetical protein
MATQLGARDKRIQSYIYDRKQLNLREARGVVAAKTGWDAAALDDAEHWYRNFLWLAYRTMKRDPRKVVGIRQDADEFWHAHILDTEYYSEVCEKILGKRGFLHHKPATRNTAATEKIRAASLKDYREEFPDEFEVDIHIGPFVIPCFWHIFLGGG